MYECLHLPLPLQIEDLHGVQIYDLFGMDGDVLLVKAQVSPLVYVQHVIDHVQLHKLLRTKAITEGDQIFLQGVTYKLPVQEDLITFGYKCKSPMMANKSSCRRHAHKGKAKCCLQLHVSHMPLRGTSATRDKKI